MTVTTLGDLIRIARGSASQDDLAASIRRTHPKLKVSGARISRYERNKQIPRLPVLTAIAEATEKPLDFFRTDVDGNGAGEQTPDDEEEGDAAVRFKAAYVLDLAGEHQLADALRAGVRRAKFQRASLAQRELVGR